MAVVVVNLDGATLLEECLASLAEQTYPRHLLRVVVVDNGSRDDSLALLRHSFGWVEVIALPDNVGFAPAVNIGVRATGAQCIVLLNNDCRAAPDMVERLVEAYQPQEGVVSVGARILDWSGASLDFAGGAMNFHGMAYQPRQGDPADGHGGVEELFFACGAAMLVDRSVYLETGGFDDAFFAYFEDVDFGWRLWIAGHRVVFAPRAVAFHRLHGTASRFPTHQRLVLYERNALQMIMKNYGDERFQRILGPALLLVAQRAVLRGGSDRGAYDIGGDVTPEETVSREMMAHVHAVADIARSLPDIMRRRAAVQASRKRPDEEVLPLMREPFWPVLADEEYRTALADAIDAFGLKGLFAT